MPDLNRTVDVGHAETRLDDLLHIVESGSEVLLLRGEIPIARLVPFKPGKKARQPGLHPGAIEMGPDFDESLPDDFWTGEDLGL